MVQQRAESAYNRLGSLCLTAAVVCRIPTILSCDDQKGWWAMSDNVAQQAVAAVNLDRAIKLRVRGAHWGEIARDCGYPSPAAALKAVGEAMAAATQRASETADQMRDTANLQLDALLSEAWTMLEEHAPYDVDGNTQDDRAVRLRAVDEARRLIESKAKLNKLSDKQPEAEDDVMKIRIVGITPEELI